MKKPSKKEIEKELKKIKPIELKTEKKEEKKGMHERQEFREEFHDASVWQSSGFMPEQITSNARVEKLEEFAEQIPSIQKPQEESVDYTAAKPSGESYTPSSDYLSADKKYRAAEREMRPAPILEARREGATPVPQAQMPFREEAGRDFSRQRQEFERQQEQYHQELREKAKLPFQRGRRKTEIF